MAGKGSFIKGSVEIIALQKLMEEVCSGYELSQERQACGRLACGLLWAVVRHIEFNPCANFLQTVPPVDIMGKAIDEGGSEWN